MVYPSPWPRDQGASVPPTPDSTRLGKYRVLEHVADGPLAEVLLARLDGIAGFSRRYAIKWVRPELAADPDVVARLEDAARKAAGLAHGNIAQVLDLGRSGERPFVVVEWVDGWDLGRILRRAIEVGRPLPVQHVAWIGWQVLKAVEYAHERQSLGEGHAAADPFVHGALGVEDVLISRGGEVKVSDFGIARLCDELGQVPGTPRVERSAPEQLSGQQPDASTDVFAVAMLLSRALLLAHPFDETGEGGLRGAILAGRRRDLAAARPDVPEALRAALDHALQGDRSRRAGSVRELKEALAEASLEGGGDVFTQETLAAWLRELFDEPERWAEVQAGQARAVDLLDTDDDSPPTRPNVDAYADDIVSVPLGGDRTEPLVRPQDAALLLDDDDGRTAVGAVQAAVSQSVRAIEAPPAPSQGWNEGGVTEVRADVASAIENLRDPRGGDVAITGLDLQPVEPPAPRTFWLTGALLGFGLVAAGAAAGALAVVGALQTESLRLDQPVLEVRGAESGSVLIDGKAVLGPTSLTAGTHLVRVERPGQSAWNVELALVAGEHRVLFVEPVALPTEPEPAPPAEE